MAIPHRDIAAEGPDAQASVPASGAQPEWWGAASAPGAPVDASAEGWSEPPLPAEAPIPDPPWQDLSRFRLPPGFRGRPAWVVQLWWLTQSLLFQPSPQFAFGFRNALLRLFGARIGPGVRIQIGRAHV